MLRSYRTEKKYMGVILPIVFITVSLLWGLVPLASAQQSVPIDVKEPPKHSCPAVGGVLKVAIGSKPNTLNWFVAGSSWEILVLTPIYNRLVRFYNGTLVKEVAQSIEMSPDGKVYTIKIVSGIKFHDGKPLTAEDVAFTINMLRNSSWAYYYGVFRNVDRAEAVDPTTVRVYMKVVDAGFVENALSVMNIMPKHIWEPKFRELGDGVAKYNPSLSELVGSGPFIVTEFQPDQFISYKANTNYWQGRPCIDQLVMSFIGDASVALLALEKGDIQTYSGFITPEVVPRLLSNPSIAIHVYTSDFYYHWGLNNKKWPFNITLFRKALAYAVDYDAIINTVLMGYGVRGSPGFVPPFGVHAKWYNPNLEYYTYNLSKAAEILDQLGFKDIDGDGWREAPDGSKFKFEIYPPSYDIIRVRAAEIIADSLAKIPKGGIKAEVRIVEWATAWALIRGGQVDTWLLGSGPGYDISWLQTRFHSKGSANWNRYSNPEVDKLIDQLVAELDPNKRRELAWKIQEILADEVPAVNLYYRKFVAPYRVDAFEGWVRVTDDDLNNWWNFLNIYSKTGKPVAPTPPPTTPLTTQVVTQTVVAERTVTQVATLTQMQQAPSIDPMMILMVAIAGVVVVAVITALLLMRKRAS
ncbi:MAG: ABC transporter substrate-binding protein [Sulfolobales archaeon]